jgi:hypothetical protein
MGVEEFAFSLHLYTSTPQDGRITAKAQRTQREERRRGGDEERRDHDILDVAPINKKASLYDEYRAVDR